MTERHLTARLTTAAMNRLLTLIKAPRYDGDVRSLGLRQVMTQVNIDGEYYTLILTKEV